MSSESDISVATNLLSSKKTYVEVDIGRLETYLTSIKGQLDRHEEELKNPVWWAAFKAEVDQVAVLGKKVEHQAIDINIIRDLVSTQDQSKSGRSSPTYVNYGNNTPNKSGQDKKMELLGADVEALKLMVRHIEAQSAADRSVFSQIRELQRTTRSMRQLVDERAPPEALKTVMELVVSFQKIKPLFDRRLSSQEEAIKKELLSRIPGMAEEISQHVYALNRAQEQACVLQSEYDNKIKKLEKYINGIEKDFTAFAEQSGIKSFAAGKRTIDDVMRRRFTIKQRDCLTRWKKVTIMEREYAIRSQKKVMAEALATWNRGLSKLGQRFFFDYWLKRVTTLRKWDLYRIRVSKMISYWISRVQPDIKMWLLRWKSNVILMRSSVENNSPDLRVQLAASQRQILDLPINDLTSKVIVLGESVQKVAKAHIAVDEWVHEHKANYLKTVMKVEANKIELNVRIDSQIQNINEKLSRQSDFAISSLSALGLRAEKNENLNAQEFVRVDDELDRINKRLKSVQDILVQHDHKFERIFLLQGQMLSRLEALEGNWSSIAQKMTECIEKSTSAGESAEAAMHTTHKLNKQVEESLFFYDEEFKGMRSAGRIAHNLIEETSHKHRDLMDKLNDMERSINNRLNDADDAILQVQSILATPNELADLCNEFEIVAVTGHGAGREATEIINEEHVSVPLTDFVLRLAKQMSAQILRRAVEKAINGPRPAPPMSTGIEVTDRDFTEETLNQFNEEFVLLIRERNDEPGYARAQARVIFHRRFMSAMKTALNGNLPAGFQLGSPARPERSSSPSRDMVFGERLSRGASQLYRSAAVALENRPKSSPVPPKWKAAIETNIAIQKDDNRSATDYDYYTMSMKTPDPVGASPYDVAEVVNTHIDAGDSAIPSAPVIAQTTPIQKRKALLDRQQAERSLSAGAVRHRSAVQDAQLISSMAAKSTGHTSTEMLVAAKNNRKLANALSAAFDSSKSIPYERSNVINMDTVDSNPLQARKLYSSIL